MKSKSIWFIVVYVLFMPDLFTGNQQKNDYLIAADLWLSDSSLGTLFYAKKINESEDKTVMILNNKNDYSNPAKMWQSWRYLKSQYEAYNLSLTDELYSAMLRVSPIEPERFEVKLVCKDSSQFSIRIYRDNGQIKVEEDMSFERNVGVTPYEALRDVSFSNFNACMMLPITEEKVFSKLASFLEGHYEAQKRVMKYYKFDRNMEQDGSMTVRVEGLKAIVTSKFHEQMELRFSSVALGKDSTYLCYQLSGEYSSGIFQPGEFVDLKKSYVSELVTYNEQLKALIGKLVK